MLLGNKIRSLRDEKGILQRQVAAYLEIAFFLKTKKSTQPNRFLFSCVL